ncbi:MAG: hypothetical protein WCO94_15900, partial [Verrucomicrobiota bacterium]
GAGEQQEQKGFYSVFHGLFFKKGLAGSRLAVSVPVESRINPTAALAHCRNGGNGFMQAGLSA